MKENKVRKPKKIVTDELLKYFKKMNIKVYSEKSFLEDSDSNNK